jgi:anaerobic selenocysteine-containing dehydrogenase
MSAWEIVDRSLRDAGLGSADAIAARGWIDRAPDFRAGHFLDGFPTRDGRFHFKPDWAALGPYHAAMPPLPDYVATSEAADDAHPFRLVAPPARHFLNSSFSETPGSRRREGRPTALIHPEDAAVLGIGDGARVRLGNRRGAITLAARLFDGLRRGTIVTEGVWPSRDFPEGVGVNQLIGGDPVPPNGGVAFHDTAVWLRPVLDLAEAAE